MSHGEESGGERGVWVVIPYKGPHGSKRRLSPLLNEDERARLSRALFDGVLDAALGTRLAQRILVIQPPEVRRFGRDHERLAFVQEEAWNRAGGAQDGADGLNRALAHAQRIAAEGGAESLLILPSDLPLIGTADVEALIRAGAEAPSVISPDRVSEGTNALLLRPPAAMQPAFGVRSFARHQAGAAEIGLRMTVLRRQGLTLDLDTPADVLRLYALAPDCRAASLLQEMGVTQEAVGRFGLTDAVSSGA